MAKRAQARGSYRIARSAEEVESLYFESYSHLGIHQEMLQDVVRTRTYRDAIFANRARIEGKVVLDVGCGTGILSIFAARAGARKVYAVDAADIAVQAAEVVRCNGLEGTITVLHKKIEEVELDEPVDVIISEWMGYLLLYENMLASVIHARDKFLRPGGLILPSSATIFAAPFTYEERYDDLLEFWNNVYGVNMSCMVPLAKKCFFSEPCIEPITAENVLTFPAQVFKLDCSTVTTAELDSVCSTFKTKSMIMATMHGVALWFSVQFPVPEPANTSQANSARVQNLAPSPPEEGSPDGPSLATSGPDPSAAGASGQPDRADANGQAEVEAPHQEGSTVVPSSSAYESQSSVCGKRKSNRARASFTSPSDTRIAPSEGPPSNSDTRIAPSEDARANGLQGRGHDDADAVPKEGKGGLEGEAPALLGTQEKGSGRERMGSGPLVLSTAPEAPPTHWMQALLFVDDPIPLQQDTEVEGEISISRSSEAARLLSIQLSYKVGSTEGKKTFSMK